MKSPEKEDPNDTLRKAGPDVLRARSDAAPKAERSEVEAKADRPAAAKKIVPQEELETDLGNAQPVNFDDFFAYMPKHEYIFVPTREMWPASSVNVRLGPALLTDSNGNAILDADGEPQLVAANVWLDLNKSVEQITWAPGLPMIIADRLIAEGGWIERVGLKCFNLYRPPTMIPGDARKAGPWLKLVRKLYHGSACHIVRWLAQRVQQPQEKINHALFLGGAPGIGKDSILEPVKRTIGPWNFVEASPQQMLGRFNGFLKSVICRMSEARDMGDVNRYQLYEHLKPYTAAPPDVLRVDEKNLREHAVLNCTGIIITSNYKEGGIYLPPDDRRHYVAWSDLEQGDFKKEYWIELYRWYNDGGDRHVAAYLTEFDLSSFDPKAPPPKTAAFWEIVQSNQVPEDSELADVLDAMKNPDATTMTKIADSVVAGSEFYNWLKDRKNSRLIPHRMGACNYVSVRSTTRVDGTWTIKGEAPSRLLPEGTDGARPAHCGAAARERRRAETLTVLSSARRPAGGSAT